MVETSKVLRHPNAAQMLGWKRIPTAALGSVAVLLAIVSLIVSAGE